MDIATLLVKIDELYELRLDRAMRKFATKNKAFYDDYQNARLIVNLGGRREKAEPGEVTPAGRRRLLPRCRRLRAGEMMMRPSFPSRPSVQKAPPALLAQAAEVISNES